VQDVYLFEIVEFLMCIVFELSVLLLHMSSIILWHCCVIYAESYHIVWPSYLATNFSLIVASPRLACIRLITTCWQEIRWSYKVLSQCAQVGEG